MSGSSFGPCRTSQARCYTRRALVAKNAAGFTNSRPTEGWILAMYFLGYRRKSSARRERERRKRWATKYSATRAELSPMFRYRERSAAESVSESIEQERLLPLARRKELERITKELRGAEACRFSVGR